MAKPLFIDIHCHPSLKPFGHSHPWGRNSIRTRKKRSIWHRVIPTGFHKLLNRILTMTRFTQSDFQTLCEGNVKVVIASISPVEKGFFVSRVGDGLFIDLLAEWATGIGRRKINFIQRNRNYFSELKKEMKFYEQLHDREVKIGGVKKKYRLVRKYDDILNNLAESEHIISVVLSIEGGHVFTEDNSLAPIESQVMDTIDRVLSWDFKPFFLSPAHHFYNHFCGHAYSLSKLMQKLIDQDDYVNTGITDLGQKAIRKLLDNRVLIDIKHMSKLSRREFYVILSEPQYTTIPIIVSHGSVNGHASVYSDINYSDDNGLFYGGDINFFDDEIVNVARSIGLFGLQLDERRIASKKEISKARNRITEEEKLEMYSGFLWNQMLHIARVLDGKGMNAWDSMCIGSDYDGVIDPLNGFWTACEFDLLHQYVLQHIKNHLAISSNRFQKDENNLPAEVIAEKLFSKNVMDFLSVNFY